MKKNRLKILIPNATSPVNLGDQAMLEVLLRLVKSTHRNAKVTIHSTDPQLYKQNTTYRVDHTLYSWSVFSSEKWLVRVFRLMQLVVHYFGKKFRVNINLPFKDYNKMKDLINDYEKADLIIFAPGGYIRSKKGLTQTLNLFMQLFLFELAKLFYAKKIVAPISFGPFAYKWQGKIAAKALQGLDLVAAREKYSYKLMKDYKVSNLILSSDYALLLKKKARKTNKGKRIVLGFTIRSWFQKKRQNDFEEAFTEAIRRFSIKANATIQPIAQVNAPKYGEDDVSSTKKIIAKIKNKNVDVLKIKKPHTVKGALEAYSNIDLLLGMRMHSNILAAIQGTPFVAVSYEYKTEGIMESLGVKQFCISCEEMTANKLTNLLNDLYKAKSTVRKRIEESIKSIKSVEDKRWGYLLKEGGYR